MTANPPSTPIYDAVITAEYIANQQTTNMDTPFSPNMKSPNSSKYTNDFFQSSPDATQKESSGTNIEQLPTSPSKKSPIKPKKTTELEKELQRNWAKSALNFKESEKKYQSHLRYLKEIKPQIDTKPPTTSSLKKKNKKKIMSNHGREWSPSFVLEKSLLTPQERHKIASFRGTDRTIPNKIEAPFYHGSAHVGEATTDSIYQHGINEFGYTDPIVETEHLKTRPNTAPNIHNNRSEGYGLGKRVVTSNGVVDSHNCTTSFNINNKNNIKKHLMKKTYTPIPSYGIDISNINIQDSKKNEDILNRQNNEIDINNTQKTQVSNNETMAYASGSGTNLVRTKQASQSPQPPQVSNQSLTQEVSSKELSKTQNNKQKKKKKQDISNNEQGTQQPLAQKEEILFETEELLINRLPEAGLRAYDTLCKVLAHLEPGDRLKVVECVLIDSGEISKTIAKQKAETSTK